MAKWLPVFLIALLQIFPVAGIFAADKRSELDAITQFEQDWLQALMAKDRASLDAILADDFMDSTWKGELHTKQQYLDALANRPPYKQKMSDLKINIYGITAVARGVMIVSDQMGKVLTQVRFTDVLVNRNGRWLAVAAQETALDASCVAY
jgi:hypothetical protein